MWRWPRATSTTWLQPNWAVRSTWPTRGFPDAPARPGADAADDRRTAPPGRLAGCARGAAYVAATIAPRRGPARRLLGVDAQNIGTRVCATRGRRGSSSVRAEGGT